MQFSGTSYLFCSLVILGALGMELGLCYMVDDMKYEIIIFNPEISDVIQVCHLTHFLHQACVGGIFLARYMEFRRHCHDL